MDQQIEHTTTTSTTTKDVPEPNGVTPVGIGGWLPRQNFKDIFFIIGLSVIALLLLVTAATLNRHINQSSTVIQGQLMNQLRVAEQKVYTLENRASVLRMYLHTCRDNEARGTFHDRCDLVEADFNVVATSVNTAKEEVSNVKVELAKRGIDYE